MPEEELWFLPAVFSLGDRNPKCPDDPRREFATRSVVTPASLAGASRAGPSWATTLTLEFGVDGRTGSDRDDLYATLRQSVNDAEAADPDAEAPG